MFGSQKGKRSAEIDSLVGSNTRICGDVYFSGGLHVDGTIQGNVIAESENSMLTTSERGRIEGNVKVHNIVLNGEVVGDVHALKHIELAANGRVTGNVYYHVIEMAMGAEVNGNLIHTKTQDSTVAKPVASKPSAEATSAPAEPLKAEPLKNVASK